MSAFATGHRFNLKSSIGSLSVIGLLMSSACAAQVTASEDSRELARIDLEDGSSVRFVEIEPGELLIEGEGPVGSEGVLAVKSSQDLDPLALFEELAPAEQVPSALRAAHERVLRARALPADAYQAQDVANNVEDAVDRASTKGGIGRTSSALTATEFEDDYCPSGFDFLFCLLNRTGGGTTQENGISMHGCVNPYRGQVTYHLEYKSGLNWNTVALGTAVEDSEICHGTSGPTRQRRYEISDASGDGYHRSVYGNR